jgi:hypothetical protein
MLRAEAGEPPEMPEELLFPEALEIPVPEPGEMLPDKVLFDLRTGLFHGFKGRFHI